MPRFRLLQATSNTLLADRRMAGAVLAAGVAFRLFLMLLPLALLTAAMLGFVDAQAGPQAAGEAARQYGFTYATAQTIAASSREAASGSWVLLLSGLILLLWTGNGLVQALRSAFFVVWHMDPVGSRSVRAAIVVVLALTATVALTMLTAAVTSASPLVAIGMTALLAAGSFGLWLLVCLQLPHACRRWTSMIPGSLMMAAGLVLLHLGTALFAANRIARASQLYGSFGLVSTLMFWLFLLGRMMVASAQLNAILWFRSRESDVDGLHRA